MTSVKHVDLRLSLRSYKSAFTRLGDTVEGFLLEGLHCNSLELANGYSVKYKAQLEKLAEATDKLCATGPTDIDALYDALDLENKKFIKIHARLAEHIVAIEKIAQDAAAASYANLATNATALSNHGGAQIAPGRFVDASLKPFILTKSHNPQELRRWCKAFLTYFESGPLPNQPVVRQRGFLNLCIDTELQVDLEDFAGPTTPILGPEGCLKILEDRFRVFHPTFNRRVELFNIKKEKGENSSALLTRVKTLGLDADVDLLDKEGILAFIFLAADGDEEIRREVRRSKSTSLDTIREIVEQRMIHLKENEAVAPNSRAMDGGVIAAVVPGKQRQAGAGNRFRKLRSQPPQPRDSSERCPRCARSGHKSENCFVLAQGLTCHSCQKEGHISPACRARLANNTIVGAVVPAVAGVDGDLPEVTPRLPVTLSHPSGCFDFKSFPDTGSGGCIISSDLVRQHGFDVLPPSNHFRFSSITGQRLRIVGRVIACTTVIASGHAGTFYFEISPDLQREIILSYKALRVLKIIDEKFPINSTANKIVPVDTPKEASTNDAIELKDKLCAEFSDVLGGILPDVPMAGNAMDIHLNDRTDIRPTKVMTARAVPLHFQRESDGLVAKLLDEGIIDRVSVPTEWCAPAFFVKKPSGGLRLVTDFTGLNRRVKRPVHPFPAPQDIISGLSPTSKIFAKLDALSGYFQVPLTDEASYLTTFLLPSGTYRYLRAPMGLSSSSDEFCRRSDAVFAGLPGIRKLVDDILVEGDDLDDLEKKLRLILNRCRDHGFVLSKKKFEIGPEVEFAGYVVSGKGVRPSPRRLEAISEFPAPTDITSLCSFLGLCNQLSMFIPDLAALASPLRGLLKKGVPFCWLPDHGLAFEKMKRTLVKTVAIHHFDRQLHTKLITDASKLNGIGFILIQTSDADSLIPINLLQCGSRSLTATERNYATIEIECLGIQWALKKCDFFLRGLEYFSVVTDHRPLVGIFSKALSSVDNPRLVRIIEKTSPYSFDVTWTSGKTNVVADALSRNPVGFASDPEGTNVPVRACVVGNSDLVDSMKKAASSCASYRSIVAAFQSGQHPSALPASHPSRRLLSVWNQLSIVDGGILCVDAKRIFVPIECRKSILERLHAAHPGITKMYHTARSLYFWPGLKSDIM